MGEKLGEKVGEKAGEKVGESLGEIHKLNLCPAPAPAPAPNPEPQWIKMVTEKSPKKNLSRTPWAASSSATC